MNLYEIKELLYRPPFNSFLHFENEEQTLSTIITIKFSKKGLYKGEINDNFLPDGKGILFLENGDIYYGDFNNGIKEGKGKYIYKDLEDVRLTQTLKHLLYYIVDTKKGDLHHLQKAIMVKSSEYLEFDISTKKNLELIETIRNREKYQKG